MLLIVDAQIDFINGSLAVEGALPAMNSLAEFIDANGAMYTDIVLTADWHPASHLSFKDNGGQWPAHCIAFSHGAALYTPVYAAALQSPARTAVLTKGTDAGKEEYSIFANEKSCSITRDIIAERHISHIDICGIAGDVCVSDTLLDGLRLFPDVRFTVIPRFCPSIDNGVRLDSLIAEHSVDSIQ